jgi:hypothetical protein
MQVRIEKIRKFLKKFNNLFAFFLKMMDLKKMGCNPKISTGLNFKGCYPTGSVELLDVTKEKTNK